MNKIKETILELIKTKPKHYGRMVKSNPELWPFVSDCYGDTAAEKIYNFLYAPEIICKNGNRLKFKSIFDGYGFCGPAGKCQCTAESVSKSVSTAKQNYDDDTKLAINNKRSETNIQKYGVANTGQLEKAIHTRKALYNDKEKVQILVDQVKNTKLQRHGDANYNNSTKIKETFKEKYPMEYWCERYNNPNLLILSDKEQLIELYNTYTVPEIADQLNVHIGTVNRYLLNFGLRDKFVSSEELEVVRFLESLGVSNIIRNTRTLLPSKKEIDIYLPDYAIAIEYNGVYWHHEDVPHITKTYHYDKYAECSNMGIQLITIFSNFWLHQQEIVKKILINKVGLDTNRVFARHCKIGIPGKAEAKLFLVNNHIQGYTTSSIQYGLYRNDELLALMTFGKTRLGMGKQEDGHELIRYASSNRIVGGASKLLAHFIKSHNPSKIISYSDNEWSNGNLYAQLGFTLDRDIKSSYWFLSPKKDKLMHRFNFAKQKLVKMGYDSALTERQITAQMGLLKVWDCGKKRWVMCPSL